MRLSWGSLGASVGPSGSGPPPGSRSPFQKQMAIAIAMRRLSLASSAQDVSKRGSALPACFDFSALSLIVDQHCCPVISLSHFVVMAADDQRAAATQPMSQFSADL
eukprot:4477613-Pyramimonas_sp.AAC.2